MALITPKLLNFVNFVTLAHKTYILKLKRPFITCVPQNIKNLIALKSTLQSVLLFITISSKFQILDLEGLLISYFKLQLSDYSEFYFDAKFCVLILRKISSILILLLLYWNLHFSYVTYSNLPGLDFNCELKIWFFRIPKFYHFWI